MLLKIIAVACLTISGFHAWGSSETDLTDVSTDVEELQADSDAAIARAKAAKIRVAKETAENDRQQKAAVKAREKATAKRVEARKQLKADQRTIDSLMKKQARLKTNLQAAETDIATAEHAIHDSQDRTAKKQNETKALEALKTEKQNKIADENKQREHAIAEGKAADQARDKAETELKQATEEESLARKNYEKTVVEEAKHKVRVEEQIAALKERFKASKNNVSKLEKELERLRQQNQRLEAQAEAGAAEIKKSEQREAELNAQIKAANPALATTNPK